MIHSDTMKEIVSLKFAQGKISFDELAKSLGFEEAEKVAFFVEISKKSLESGV